MWPSPTNKTPAGRQTCASPSMPRTRRRACPSPAGNLMIYAPTTEDLVIVMVMVTVTVNHTHSQAATTLTLETDSDTA